VPEGSRYVLRSDLARSHVIARLAYLNLASQTWEVLIRPFRPQRSLAQNARYWALVSAVAAETGHTPEEVHEVAKARLLGLESVEAFGIRVDKPRSSAELNVGDFTDYMTRFEAWVSVELGIVLPAWSWKQ
jgi:hypothetical protein